MHASQPSKSPQCKTDHKTPAQSPDTSPDFEIRQHMPYGDGMAQVRTVATFSSQKSKKNSVHHAASAIGLTAIGQPHVSAILNNSQTRKRSSSAPLQSTK